MEHPDEGTIHAWLDDALSPEESGALTAHVATCDRCSAAVAEARGLIAASSRIVATLDDVPAGVIPQVAPRSAPSMGATLASGVRSARVQRAWWNLPGLAAAAVLVVATSAVWLRGGDESVAELAVSADTATAISGPYAAPAQAPTPSAAVADASAPAAIGAAAPATERAELKREATMSAPASKPVPSAPPRQTSPMIGQVADGSPRRDMSGGGAQSLSKTDSAVAGGLADVAVRDSRMSAAKATGAVGQSTVQATAQAAPPIAATPPAAAPPTANQGFAARSADASQARERREATIAAPMANALESSARVIPGCYAIAQAHVPALQARGIPVRFRLTDTLASPSAVRAWFVVRPLGGDSRTASTQWSPDRDLYVMLRAITRSDTSLARVHVGVQSSAADKSEISAARIACP